MKENDISTSINGSTILTDAGATYPTVSKLYLGCWDSAEFLYGVVKKVSLYDKKLSNAEIVALTENN
jgi:hypothetical protein